MNQTKKPLQMSTRDLRKNKKETIEVSGRKITNKGKFRVIFEKIE
jgi:hypothetical protein